ncbi:MAG: exodeoxyribonuclease VII small subunit [Bacilli bacterium]|nr:exodeoxyribonuclease VII small subunit [Bacilli bacterium]MBR3049171.1 exodeoxyribonuclease VII small subunit [Bacilli bacterium]
MAEKKEKSFEENLKDLEEIVNKLESGEVPLDDAIKEFTKAMELSKKCDQKLKSAEEAITKIVEKDGSLKDFKVEE